MAIHAIGAQQFPAPANQPAAAPAPAPAGVGAVQDGIEPQIARRPQGPTCCDPCMKFIQALKWLINKLTCGCCFDPTVEELREEVTQLQLQVALLRQQQADAARARR